MQFFPPAQQIIKATLRHTPSLFHSCLCRPDTLDKLGDTNVVRLKLVQAHTNNESRAVQRPPENLVQTGMCSLGDVVDNNLLETHVGVEEESTAEDGIGGGVERASGEGSNGQGDETGSDEALERPVVGAVGGAGLRNGSWVVDCKALAIM